MPAGSGLTIGDVTIASRVLIAPMTGVSDLPFRQTACRLGAAYVATEMVACDSLARGRPDVVRRAAVGDGLPLTVIQLVGRDPAQIAAGARMAEAAGAELIDLNFGCPAKEVTGGASGSALMRDPAAARAIFRAAVSATDRPVTVKMRLGWDQGSRNAAEIAQIAQDEGVQAVTVHGRTRQAFYTGAADWRAVATVASAVAIPVIVNGDVVDVASAQSALALSGAAGVMLGRGIYGRPWLAAALAESLQTGGPLVEPDMAARLDVALDQFRRTLAFYGDRIGHQMFKKHLGHYILAAPYPAAADDRRSAKARLCRLQSPAEVEQALIALWTASAPLEAAA